MHRWMCLHGKEFHGNWMHMNLHNLGNTAVANDGDHVVTIVAQNNNRNTHAGIHDFFTFRRGMEIARCKPSLQI